MSSIFALQLHVFFTINKINTCKEFSLWYYYQACFKHDTGAPLSDENEHQETNYLLGGVQNEQQIS